MTVAFVVTVAIVLGLVFFLIHQIHRPAHASNWDRGPYGKVNAHFADAHSLAHLQRCRVGVFCETTIDVRGTRLWLVGLADLWTRPQRIDETFVQVPQGGL